VEKKDRLVILITGSSRGIGKKLVQRFAELGHRIVLNFYKGRKEAETLTEELELTYGKENVLLVQADVSKRNDVKELFERSKAQFGTVNILINNAGINLDGPFLEMTDEQWNRVIETNLTGTFICSQEFALQLGEGEGHIINLGAATGIHGRKNGANYCSSKAGIITLTKCLALELAPKVMVNCVVPGFIATDEVIERYGFEDPEKAQAVIDTIPAGRLGRVEDIVRTAEFILFGSSFITGQSFFVNGGDYRH